MLVGYTWDYKFSCTLSPVFLEVEAGCHFCCLRSFLRKSRLPNSGPTRRGGSPAMAVLALGIVSLRSNEVIGLYGLHSADSPLLVARKVSLTFALELSRSLCRCVLYFFFLHLSNRGRFWVFRTLFFGAVLAVFCL